MGVLITRGMFGKDDGQIQWYGIIATTNLSLGRPPRKPSTTRGTTTTTEDGTPTWPPCSPTPSTQGPGPCRDPGWCLWAQRTAAGPGEYATGSSSQVPGTGSALWPPDTIISFSAFSEPRAGVSRVAVPLPAAVGLLAGCCLGATALGLLCWWRAKARRADKNRFSQELTPYNLRRTHRPIPIQSFRQSYEAKSAHAHQAFFQEFEELKEVGKEQPRLEAEHPANATKNRYPHVLPYDHSQVRLSQLEGEPHSDYINASFIPGYTDPQEFIATQGPLRKTVEDFWRLVWEQQVHVIVMLTVGMENRVLCEHYWPVGSTPVTHGHITVHLLAEEPEDEWTKREFQLQHSQYVCLHRCLLTKALEGPPEPSE